MASNPGFNRRDFLIASGAVAGTVAAGMVGACQTSANGVAPIGKGGITLVRDPADPIASSPPAQWATAHLREALTRAGLTVREAPTLEQAAPVDLCILIAGSKSPTAAAILDQDKITAPYQPEALALVWSKRGGGGGRSVLLATGFDPRGLVYALTDLADRINHSSAPLDALAAIPTLSESPANPIRGIMRLFASDVEDKPWFYDRAFWPAYFDMLITHRFNRFNLALGLSYDFSSGLRDVYFFFAYPFLLNVPGFNVRAIARDGQPLPAEEQQRNLETLHFITDQAALRGLDFQLGLWTHNYRWAASPQATYTIDGLNPQTQAPYCREALHRLLDACPGITGITLRTHGESGVPEGSYDIWKTIMSGITGLKTAAGTPRTIELDLHGKTMTPEMIQTAQSTNMPVTISCKLWAEHWGLPYIQSSIRQTEMPRPPRNGAGLMALSDSTRSFLRYGVGDLLTKDRKYKVINRVWPGTQRLLLWGDPLYAAGYGRCSSFCGMEGIEYFDPLSFKGRAGSGLPPAVPGAGRSGYADPSLVPEGGDWRKFLYTYRLLGRLSYNPDAAPDTWQRQLRFEFGLAAGPMETALASASRILPLITTAHLPCAANFNYWPEIYVNMSLYDITKVGSYGEVPNPKIFANVSSLDPQLFASINEYADALLTGKPFARITPIDVAQQLEAWSQSASTALANVAQQIARPAAAHRRAAIDATIAAGLGQFFAYKLRAGVLYALFDRSGHEPARAEALKAYRLARDTWRNLADTAKVYAHDLTFGPARQLRGHWQDRLADIDTDITGLQTRAATFTRQPYSAETIAPAMTAILKPAPRSALQLTHTPPKSFTPGKPLALSAASTVESVTLWYRHINQGERYMSADMSKQASAFSATIPADYTNSPFPLEYYFELRTATAATLYPGFKDNFTGQPYFTIPQA